MLCVFERTQVVYFREARLNEAASRQTLSRVRWRQCG
jgi:hypothetical protein